MQLYQYLQALKLPTFIKNYQAFARDAARSGQSYERFLLGLAKEEVTDQYDKMVQRAIARAKFPESNTARDRSPILRHLWTRHNDDWFLLQPEQFHPYHCTGQRSSVHKRFVCR
jgi:hypothetical protein